jgi:hypothetical protein
MRKLPWFKLALLTVASGLFAFVAMPSAADKQPDGEKAARELGLDYQRPAPARVTRASEPPLEPTPQGSCGPGSRPETGLQGEVTREDHTSGLAEQGFTCNTELVGKYTRPNTPLNTVPGFENAFGTVGGFKVLRYVDDAGHECAYYDTTLLFPTNIFDALVGVNVLDMADPSNPVLSDRLVTPAMLSPHESLVLSEKRGLLAAVTGNPAFYPGIVDVYDISQDCRHPVLESSLPTGILGHESGMAPDGNTFYSASPGSQTLVPVDISNPSLTHPLAAAQYDSHGLTISSDGNRAYVAGINSGLIIVDTSQVQARAPNPQLPEIARLQWQSMSIPQNAIPVTINGHGYVVEVDEFGTLSEVGAARIIDIGDETNPHVVSNMRLEVHQPENFEEISGDVGAGNSLGGYAAHYCSVPRTKDPEIVACTMILSGLRIFDIRDPENPREIGYFNAPIEPRTFPGGSGFPPGASNWAMSAPTFAPERNEIWYSDGYAGFFAVRVTNGAWPGGAASGGAGAGASGGASSAGRRCRGLEPTIVVTAGRAAGTSGRDVILGTSGPDRILGGGGNDVICAGNGKDKVSGGRGKDKIFGGSGRDRLRGNRGKDKIFGGSGRDRLNGGRAKDRCGGGHGRDAVVAC